MAVNRYLTGKVVLALVGVWSGALLIAYLGPPYTGLPSSLIISGLGVVGTFGILTIQIIRVVQQNAAGRTAEDASSESSVTGEEAQSATGAEDKQRITATSGLSPTERQAQNTLLKEAYQQFADGPFTFRVMRSGHPLINKVKGRFDYGEDETIEKVWRLTQDDGFFKRQPGGDAWRLTPKAVWRADELGEDILLDDDVQDEIMDVLLQAYRDDPSYPRINRDDLLAAVGFPEDEVDHNLWLLAEKGFVKTEAYINERDAGYDEVQITQLGRDVTQ